MRTAKWSAAVELAFGADVDYAMLMKESSRDRTSATQKRATARVEFLGITIEKMTGQSDDAHISTS